MMKFSFIKLSKNSKTGPIPVTYSHRDTCPNNCNLKNKGCYAETGHLLINWKNVSNSWKSFLKQIKSLRKNTLWRHNIAGDLPGENNTIDHNLLDQLVKANKGKRGFTFTHKPVGLTGQLLINGTAIYAANKNGFTINLSADGLEDADRLYDFGIAPVVCVVPSDSSKHMKTPKGRRVVVCPAEDSNITCSDCKLCANKDRKGIVAFRAHGVRKNLVNRHLKVIK